MRRRLAIAVGVLSALAVGAALWLGVERPRPANEETAHARTVPTRAVPASAAETDQASELTSSPQSEPSEPEPVRISGASDVFRLLQMMEVSPQEIAAWLASAGIPPDQLEGFQYLLGYSLDQSYEDFDDAALAALAGQGDAWASLYLAQRVRGRGRLLEANEWLRHAAVAGSAGAVLAMGMSYHEIAQVLSGEMPRPMDWPPETEQALRTMASNTSLKDEGLAYALAGERDMGLPPGSFLSSMLAGGGADRETACRRAAGIYEDLSAERVAAGTVTASRLPPVVLPYMASAEGICGDVFAAPDYAGCTAWPVILDTEGTGETVQTEVLRCPP